MPKIPGISADRAVRAFKKIGYRIIREGKHVIMSDGTTRLSIPRHATINSYTMGSIASDAGLTPEEFKKLL
jgi:predicted RNA binding protein YcfA (HicA-like mRNA interferase family)